MKKLKINNEVYKYPEKWEEVKIKTFDRIQTINEQHKNDKNKLRVIVKIYAAVTGCPEDILLKLSRDDFERLAGSLDWLEAIPQTDPKFTQKINGVVYHFPTTLNNISFGQFADLDEILKGGDQLNASILAILFLPEGEDYDANHFYKNREFWSERPVTDLLPLLSFFLSTGDALQIYTQTFSTIGGAIIGELIEAERLVKNGAGSLLSRVLPRTISLKLIRYYKKMLLRSLTS